MNRTHIIRSVTFEGDGSAVIEFVVPRDDARENGLILNHALLIPGGDDYDDEIENALDAVQALLLDALEDHRNLPRIEPRPADLDDDDDEDD